MGRNTSAATRSATKIVAVTYCALFVILNFSTRLPCSPGASKSAAHSLFGGKDLQTSGPPASKHCLDEFLGQFFLAHFSRQPRVVVPYRYQFEGRIPAGCVEKGVPHFHAAIIGGPAQCPHIHHPS